MKKFIPIICILIFASCDLPTQPGPMPKDIVDTEFEPGLNIFGILRVDGKNYGTSFIRVERAFFVHEIVKDNAIFVPTIDSARVRIIHDDGDTTQFPFKDDGTYDNENFIPETGESYSIQIDSTDFPVLMGKTSVPNLPKVIEDRSKADALGLAITPDTSIHLVEIYPIYGMGMDYAQRIAINNEDVIQFSVPTQHEKYGPLNRIEVYSYDKNMADYLQSLVALKPQVYNEMVRTVEGGYGVFGSVVKSVVY